MQTRSKKIAHSINLVEAALEALLDMSKNPDAPVDLSRYAVGGLSILKEACEVKLLFSGDNAFGIMDLPDDA